MPWRKGSAKLVAIVPRRPQYPIVIEARGMRYKAAAADVLRALGRQAPAAAVASGWQATSPRKPSAKLTRAEREYAMEVVREKMDIRDDISDAELTELCKAAAGVHPRVGLRRERSDVLGVGVWMN